MQQVFIAFADYILNVLGFNVLSPKNLFFPSSLKTGYPYLLSTVLPRPGKTLV